MAAIAAAAPFSARAWVATHGDALHVDELFIEKLKLAALDRFALDGGDALLEFGDEVRADAAEAYADTWVREGLEALEAHAASGRSLRRAPKPADVDALACKLTVSDLRPAACFLLSYSPHDTKHPLASDVASFGSKERGSKASYSYSDAHVDKAQVPAYDVSAVLYFNTIGSGFDGGGFAFVDGDGDTVVEPRAGRLLVFSSGCENLHRVLAVTRGTRFAMTMWWSLRS
ncbi:hypothetical protein AURANDRAFT_65054 [Aureococcus anophagefferens]|uniref:Fe2OG dioxygenase domain-containing protein n=1 Tax=Aureococcus anophagefferens TaxID=44056 RepID=F0YCH7_AURAN|nr:hypothetical protein AURANDRAFT_65054 [Aureococcus anophagefferens]EGB07182.1 hypothetical protein AURANDRAFT_65054 [Aureococcus anophagefferens]|eukprot:XP_009038405.1 hypothetical protein AURANDRAFT_65054 [Aureococcus anophagefferens]